MQITLRYLKNFEKDSQYLKNDYSDPENKKPLIS